MYETRSFIVNKIRNNHQAIVYHFVVRPQGHRFGGRMRVVSEEDFTDETVSTEDTTWEALSTEDVTMEDSTEQPAGLTQERASQILSDESMTIESKDTTREESIDKSSGDAWSEEDLTVEESIEKPSTELSFERLVKASDAAVFR